VVDALSSQSHMDRKALSDQVALVTGGGRGIGRAIAQALGAAGAKVAVLARSADELAETVRLIEENGGRARSFPADVTVADAVRGAIKSVEQELGPVDFLVNNAAALKPFGPVWQTNVEEWWRSMEVNMLGPLLCAAAVLPGMVARRRGRIVNIASGAGTLSTPFYSSYVTSKTALIRFTECLALEAGPHGVAVFAISPGTVRTAMSEYSLNSPEGQKWLPWYQKIFDQQIDVPAERPAELVLALALGRADALSGRFLSIHDDLDALTKNASTIEQQNLYSLKMERLPAGGSNPALAAVLAEARNAAEKRGK
jgi:NAD(P)-dependent dehydrogenase (short-subunit alcohol dehydrogenase family)